MTCGPAPLAACTSDDVVVGLAQLSSQVHTLSAFLAITISFFALLGMVALVVAFVELRRG